MGKKSEGASASSTSVKPSEVPAVKNRKPLIEIPEDEQRRLIEETGILNKFIEVVQDQKSGTVVEEFVEESLPIADEIFNAVLYIIPVSFLLLMMEILIHQQYRQAASLQAILDRMIPGIPIVSLLVFYTLRYKSYRMMQLFLFVVSLLTSTRLIYLINRGNYKTNMKQDPPLATLWIYTIVQLDLGPAVLSLLTTGSFVWWNDLKILF
ncbi:hypothetical protein FA13DRAFT_1733951 [Coprinellus micaceus]|uniref:DUF7719 domain-containing protein n=1 Tax=Coprinellus micaceus TaxID=71717 RepID=A0A4Y7T7I8_COPMI|nr:hypothetical protein FA13DRAFT_1733951 [Coprinellus micaceus]